MAMFLKQSTAVTVKFGPMIDDTDGKTAEVALTLSQADFRLAKNGGDIAQKNESTSATHDELGYYDVMLDTTDTNTLGRLRVMVHESGALPAWMDFMIMSANVWDSLFGADQLQVHVNEMTAGIITATVIADASIDAATFAANAITATVIAADAITAAKIADGAIDAATFAANAITATAIAADAITDAKVASDVTIASVTGAVGSVTGAVGSVTGNVGGNVVGSVASVTAGVTLAASAVQAIWDALTSALTTVGSIGKRIADNLDATVSSRLSTAGYTAPPTAAANADAVWDETLADHLAAGSTGNALNAAGGAGDPWATAIPGAYGAGTAGKILGDNINAAISSRASQTSVDDLPTNAELATSQAAADDVTLAAISALNNLSAAQVNIEADAALADVGVTTTITGRIDAAISTRATPAQVNTEVDTAITDAALATAANLATVAGYLDTEVASILSAVDTEVAAIKVVTDALTSAAATKLALSAGTIVTGAAIAGTLSTTAMTTNLTEATSDHFNGRIIIWTSGVLVNQATDIVDYDGTTKMLTYTAVTEAPTAGDAFIIV